VIIVRLAAENFKRLRAVEITPEGNVIEIRGKNEAGKSSVLDAIDTVLRGAPAMPSKPLRRGAESGRIELVLDDPDAPEGGSDKRVVVSRRFTATGNSPVVLESAGGARFRSPQHMLDALVGTFACDPMAFTRQTAEKQVEAVRRVIRLPLDPQTGAPVDIDALDGKNARDFEVRTEVNRDAKRLRAQASGIQYPGDLPAQPIDERRLAVQLREAADANTAIERARARRERRLQEVMLDRRQASAKRERAQELRREAEDLDAAAAALEAGAGSIEQGLEAEPPPPEAADTAEIVAQLEEARRINVALADRARRETLEAEAGALEARAAALTTAMEERREKKRKAVAESAMPLEGMSIDEDNHILLNEIPLDQCSQSQKIRVGVAVAMAANPRLRFLCVRDGSLLDRASWRALSEIVTEKGYQLWVEVTDDDAQTGIIIEDGTARVAPKRDAPAAQPTLSL
jgi:hypothetical protein